MAVTLRLQEVGYPWWREKLLGGAPLPTLPQGVGSLASACKLLASGDQAPQ